MFPSTNLPLKHVKALHGKNLPYITKVTSPYVLLIHPAHLGNIKKGIKEELDYLKKTYCHDFKGIVLGWDNVKVHPGGEWFDTNPYLHLKIDSEFYIFAPKIGTVLQGKVVKKSPTHVGCLVHNLFNASSNVQNGVSKSDWCGSLVSEGDIVGLKLTAIDLTSPVPYLRGDIVPESIRKPQNTDNAVSANTRTIFEENEKVEVTEKTRMKKNKKIKAEESFEREEETNSKMKIKIKEEPFETETEEPFEAEARKEKKEKKKKIKVEKLCEAETEHVTKSKKKKKIKEEKLSESETEESFETETENVTKSEKKKKVKEDKSFEAETENVTKSEKKKKVKIEKSVKAETEDSFEAEETKLKKKKKKH